MNLRLPEKIEYSSTDIFVTRYYQATEDMYMLIKKMKKYGVGLRKPVRQSPQHQHGIEEQDILQGKAMSFLPVYVCPLRHKAPKI